MSSSLRETQADLFPGGTMASFASTIRREAFSPSSPDMLPASLPLNTVRTTLFSPALGTVPIAYPRCISSTAAMVP